VRFRCIARWLHLLCWSRHSSVLEGALQTEGKPATIGAARCSEMALVGAAQRLHNLGPRRTDVLARVLRGSTRVALPVHELDGLVDGDRGSRAAPLAGPGSLRKRRLRRASRVGACGEWCSAERSKREGATGMAGLSDGAGLSERPHNGLVAVCVWTVIAATLRRTSCCSSLWEVALHVAASLRGLRLHFQWRSGRAARRQPSQPRGSRAKGAIVRLRVGRLLGGSS